MSLRVRSLRFRYAGSRVDSLGGVDLDVAPGEICRILGPHGSGKSTLRHCVAGIAPEMRAGEREGSIALAGSDLTRGRLRDRADRLALVFQDFESQLFSTSVDLEAALAVTLAFRLAPLFLESAERVVEAQAARGFDPRGGGLVARARHFVPVVVPTLAVGLRRADSMAVALEARGFGRAGRRSARALRAGAPDLAVGAALIALAGLALLWR